MKMIIIEDNAINRELLIECFKDDFDIIIEDNGWDGLAAIKTNPNSIVLLDLFLPEMDGLDMLQALSQDEKNSVSIIIISSSNEINDQKVAFKNGAVDYITKPFDLEIVRHRVLNVTSAHKRLEEIKRQAKESKTLATYDGLTGVLNHKTCESKMEDYLFTHKDEISGFFVIDIDDFKEINDSKGHLVGDQTLKLVAKFLLSYFRSDDIVGRLGGDEFFVLMTNVKDVNNIKMKADDIINFLHYNPNFTIPANVTLSIGVSVNNGDKKSFKALYSEADSALYVAKSRGKNQYAIFGETEDSRIHNDYTLTCYSRNRLLVDAVSLVTSSVNANLTIVSSTDGIMNAKRKYEGNKNIVIVDITMEDDYHKMLTYILENLTDDNVFIAVDESDLNQISDAIKIKPLDLVYLPTNKIALERKLEKFAKNAR